MYRTLIYGLDTLVIGFYVHMFKLSDADWNFLFESKDKAKSTLFGTKGTLIEFKGNYFTLMPSGSSVYSYVLISDDLTVKIAKYPSNGRFPEIYIEFRSQFLWRGYAGAYGQVKTWVEQWADIETEKVSRVDIAIDMQGEPVISSNIIVSKCRNREVVYKESSSGTRITGYSFGSSLLMCRIYNKLEELKRSRKYWFYELWFDRGWDYETNVWRTEFQIRRDVLKEFQINSFADLESTLPDVWRYLTEEWFTVREMNEYDSNRARWKISSYWREIQSARGNFGELAGIVREGTLKQVRAENLIAQAMGIITTIGALLDKDNKQSVMDEISNLGERYLSYKGKNFNALLMEKSRKFALCGEGITKNREN